MSKKKKDGKIVALPPGRCRRTRRSRKTRPPPQWPRTAAMATGEIAALFFARPLTSPRDACPPLAGICHYKNGKCGEKVLEGYLFCLRHILEDKSAPYDRCTFSAIKKRCTNPADPGKAYCAAHDSDGDAQLAAFLGPGGIPPHSSIFSPTTTVAAPRVSLRSPKGPRPRVDPMSSSGAAPRRVPGAVAGASLAANSARMVQPSVLDGLTEAERELFLLRKQEELLQQKLLLERQVQLQSGQPLAQTAQTAYEAQQAALAVSMAEDKVRAESAKSGVASSLLPAKASSAADGAAASPLPRPESIKSIPTQKCFPRPASTTTLIASSATN